MLKEANPTWGCLILTRPAGERQEIDLVPPTAPTASVAPLPSAVCPLGEVSGLGVAEANAPPPAPGTSPLDDVLRRLDAARGGDEGGQP